MEDIPLFDNDDYLAIEQLDFPNSLKANLSPKIMATKILKINDLNAMLFALLPIFSSIL